MANPKEYADLSIADRVDILRYVGGLAYRISPHFNGWRSSSVKSQYAQAMFARIFDIATSILRLTDVDNGEPDAASILDPGSIAALARNLQEMCDLFWYLVVERTSQEEAEFRQAVWSIHYHVEAKKVADVLEPKYSRLWEIHEALRIQNIMLLDDNAVFTSLGPRAQRHIVLGRRPYFGRIRNPRRAAYLSDDVAKAFFKYLSNQTHSHPFGIRLVVPARWEPSFGRNYLLAASLDIAARELASATDDYVRRMRRCDGKLDRGEREVLRSVYERPWDIHIK